MNKNEDPYLFSIVIVNYKQKDFTLECVRSIIDNTAEGKSEIIVVNNSPEENLDELSEHGNTVKVINNVNAGFSQANNLASRESKGKYLLFLNADTNIEKDFINDFLATADELSFGAAGIRLCNPDGSFQLSFWKENTFLNEIRNKSSETKFREKDKEFISGVERTHSKVCEVDWVSGASMIVRKDIFDSIGGFDENFFLFYEDADLCKRLKDKGERILFLPIGKVIHYKGENVNENFESNTYYYSKESQLYYYSKHNNIVNRIAIRSYVAMKFAFKYLSGGNEIDKKIFKLAIGGKR